MNQMTNNFYSHSSALALKKPSVGPSFMARISSITSGPTIFSTQYVDTVKEDDDSPRNATVYLFKKKKWIMR